ncbi:hypothetical protein COOONC_17570 [Cooperia oncophora]
MSSLSHAERASVATGAAYSGGGNDTSTAGHKGGSGGWTPVKQWGRNHPSTGGAPVKGGGQSRPYVPPCRNGARGDSTSSSQDQPQLTPFGQRFGKLVLIQIEFQGNYIIILYRTPF